MPYVFGNGNGSAGCACGSLEEGVPCSSPLDTGREPIDCGEITAGQLIAEGRPTYSHPNMPTKSATLRTAAPASWMKRTRLGAEPDFLIGPYSTVRTDTSRSVSGQPGAKAVASTRGIHAGAAAVTTIRAFSDGWLTS